MTAPALRSHILVLLGILSLAACDKPPPIDEPPASAPPLDDGPAANAVAVTAAAEIVYCPRSKQHVTRLECERVTEIWDNLETGKGAIEAPSEMVRDEASTVSFAVAGETSGTTVEEVLGAEAVNGSVEAVKIGGVMSAELTGQGFAIEPKGKVRKEIGPAGSMLWEWQVTPLKNHGNRLRAQAFVVVPGPNGTTQEIFLKTYSKDVAVKVTGGQRIADWMDESSAWFARGNNWLKALAGFLAALAAVWAALKAFRPKKAEPRA
jgi:CRISPR/Cas system-associated exonuclease Cas4 (RecB family)